MSNFHYAKNLNLFYLEDKFNDTFRYPDDTFTIDNPEFEKQLPDIYPAEFQLNKANILSPKRNDTTCIFKIIL